VTVLIEQLSAGAQLAGVGARGDEAVFGGGGSGVEARNRGDLERTVQLGLNMPVSICGGWCLAELAAAQWGRRPSCQTSRDSPLASSTAKRRS
jgi:hypothetical protein